MFRFKWKKFTSSAFTLVELIVVITILAVLGTIAFIAVNSYTSKARDSDRVADIYNISKILDISNVTTGSYPSPDKLFTVTYSGGSVWYQGKVGSGVVTKMNAGVLGWGINKSPIDPLEGLEYTYSILAYGRAYQLKADYEGDLAYRTPDSSFVPTVYADSGNPTIAYIKGNFLGLTAKTQTGANICIIPVPSIITSTGSVGTTLELTQNSLSGTLLFNAKPLVNASSFNPNNHVLCSTSVPSDNASIANLMTSLKLAYSGSDLTGVPAIASVLSSTGSQVLWLWQSIVTGQLGGSVSPISFGDCSSTTFSWYAIPAIPHGITQSVTRTTPITNGVITYSMPATCTNTILSYGTEWAGVTSCDANCTWSGATSSCVMNSPANPSSSAASPSQNSIAWNWQNTAYATSYEFSVNNSTWSSKGNVLTFNETSLSCGTTYSRYVRACNAWGCGPSTTMSASTNACPLAKRLNCVSSNGYSMDMSLYVYANQQWTFSKRAPSWLGAWVVNYGLNWQLLNTLNCYNDSQGWYDFSGNSYCQTYGPISMPSNSFTAWFGKNLASCAFTDVPYPSDKRVNVPGTGIFWQYAGAGCSNTPDSYRNVDAQLKKLCRQNGFNYGYVSGSQTCDYDYGAYLNEIVFNSTADDGNYAVNVATGDGAAFYYYVTSIECN